MREDEAGISAATPGGRPGPQDKRKTRCGLFPRQERRIQHN